MSRQKIKRDPYKDYFPLPNKIFDLGLTPGEIAIYALFIKLDKANNGYCYTDYSSIRLLLALSVKTIKKYVSSLETKQIINIEQTKKSMKVSFNKRDTSKHFFLLPTEIFSMELCPGEIAVYAYLLKCVDIKKYTCYPSYNTIANHIGASVNSVKKYGNALENKGLISTEHTSIITKDYRKLNGNLLYTINPFSEAYVYYWDKKTSNHNRAKKVNYT